MASNTYTARYIACVNPITATTKTYWTLYNYLGSTNVVKIYRVWMVSTNATTAAGTFTAPSTANYVLEKFTSNAAPGGGAAVGLLAHDNLDPFWPTATTNVITGTTYASPNATFFTTATAAATVSAVTATTATPFQSQVTTSAAHGFTVGQNVTLAGMTPAGFNGTYRVIAVPTTTTFIINVTGNPGTATVFGTATGGHSYQVGQNVVVASVVSSGTGGATYNGVWQVATVPASNQFTCNIGTLSPGTWTSGGTVGPAVVGLLGNTAITGTFNPISTYRQVCRSTQNAQVSTTLVGMIHLQNIFSIGQIWDGGYGDTNVEPIVLRAGEGLRMWNQATPGGGFPATTGASFDVLVEMTIT